MRSLHGYSQFTPADDLATSVHRRGGGEKAAEGSEVDHPARLRPRERMNLTASTVTRPDNLAAVAHRHGEARAAAEGAEVDHPPRLRPRERMGRVEIGDVARTNDLAFAAHRRCPARRRESSSRAAPESTEIDRYEGAWCHVCACRVRGEKDRQQDKH